MMTERIPNITFAPLFSIFVCFSGSGRERFVSSLAAGTLQIFLWPVL